MCGIIGVALKNSLDVGWYLAKGLKRLEYRGYDSVGVAVLLPRQIVLVKKQKGDVDSFLSSIKLDQVKGCIGIGHTRWATHGEPSDINAHPHSDCTKSIYIVHNGVVRNYDSLRDDLLAKNHKLDSETDTELIAHVIEEELNNSKSFLQALARALSRVRGTYALAVIYVAEPNRIYFARRGSPLVIGVSEKGNFIASDIPALLEFTREVIVLEDGELGWISESEYKIFRMEDQDGGITLEPVYRTPKLIEWSIEEAEKGGFPHFMLKEIKEQPQALALTFHGLVEDAKVILASEMIASAERLLVIGAGSSFNSGCIIGYYLTMLASIYPLSIVSSEFKTVKSIIDEETIILAISQSGETYDTLEAVREFKKRGAKIIGITNVVGSALSRESDITIYMRAGPEIGVAATKTFLSQVLVGEILAIRTGRIVGKLGLAEEKNNLKTLSLAPKVTEASVKISEDKADPSLIVGSANSAYVLGRGLGHLISREAALKIKEIAYIHAEAYPAGESKHGPIALVEKGFPVFFIATSDAEEIGGNIAEMSARGAKVVVVKPTNLTYPLSRSGRELVIDMPEAPSILLEPYVLTPFFQVLAYKTAISRGYDPDKPRNLAKTVTVE